MSQLNEETIRQALSRVIDPELGRSITDLDMVREVSIGEDGAVSVKVDLTIAGCPLQATIEKDVREEVAKVPGVTAVTVEMGVMDEAQRAALKEKLSGQSAAAKKHHTLKPSPHSEKQWYYQAIIISNWPPGEPQSDNKKE